MDQLILLNSEDNEHLLFLNLREVSTNFQIADKLNKLFHFQNKYKFK